MGDKTGGRGPRCLPSLGAIRSTGPSAGWRRLPPCTHERSRVPRFLRGSDCSKSGNEAPNGSLRPRPQPRFCTVTRPWMTIQGSQSVVSSPEKYDRDCDHARPNHPVRRLKPCIDHRGVRLRPGTEAFNYLRRTANATTTTSGTIAFAGNWIWSLMRKAWLPSFDHPRSFFLSEEAAGCSHTLCPTATAPMRVTVP